MSTILELLKEAATTPETNLEHVFEHRCSVRARGGQVLYDAGDPSDTVYVLASGFARAYVGDGFTSRTTMLIKAPAILGDRDVLSGRTTTSDTVRLMSTSCLFAFSSEEFMEEWHASRELRELLSDDLAQRYVLTLRWIELDAGELADRVGRLLKAIGEPQPPIAMLAAMLGLSRRSIFRALAALRAGELDVSDDDERDVLVHTMGSAPADTINVFMASIPTRSASSAKPAETSGCHV